MQNGLHEMTKDKLYFPSAVAIYSSPELRYKAVKLYSSAAGAPGVKC